MNIFAANLNLKVNNVEVLKDISFTISEGKFSCLTGPSGAGNQRFSKWSSEILITILAS